MLPVVPSISIRERIPVGGEIALGCVESLHSLEKNRVPESPVGAGHFDGVAVKEIRQQYRTRVRFHGVDKRPEPFEEP